MTAMMVQKTKSWVKENFMEIVLACMITAFWVGYENDQQEEADFRDDVRHELNRDAFRIQTIARIQRDDPDTDGYDKDLLTEIIKSNTRGATINNNIQ